MNQNLVSFKGSKEGIYIYIKEGNFNTVKKHLDFKLKRTASFFRDGKVMDFKGKKLTRLEVQELKDIINGKYGIALDDSIEEESDDNNTGENNDFFQGIIEGKTKFMKISIRSGQSVEYDGNIVIFGDINPGGIIKAKGNIVVLGSLRGVAHAGSDGNREAIVAGFNLQPTQLRIADIFARRPDYRTKKTKWPEIATIKDEVVTIEPYLQKK